jgi:hypothetical protein
MLRMVLLLLLRLLLLLSSPAAALRVGWVCRCCCWGFLTG